MSSLTDAQIAAFWDGILSSRDAARRMALLFVKRQDVDDVVDAAAIQFIESLTRPEKPAPFPKTEDELRSRFLAIVRNYALDCIRDGTGAECPVHSHWGLEQEPAVGGRKVADRALDQVFARNDHGRYDAPAPAEPCDQDVAERRERILRRMVSELPPMQRMVIEETFFEGRKRGEIARRHGIMPKTYDNHYQAALRALRVRLIEEAQASTGDDRLLWYDLIDEMSERLAATRLRRAPHTKRDPSTIERARSA